MLFAEFSRQNYRTFSKKEKKRKNISSERKELFSRLRNHVVCCMQIYLFQSFLKNTKHYSSPLPLSTLSVFAVTFFNLFFCLFYYVIFILFFCCFRFYIFIQFFLLSFIFFIIFIFNFSRRLFSLHLFFILNFFISFDFLKQSQTKTTWSRADIILEINQNGQELT